MKTKQAVAQALLSGSISVSVLASLSSGLF